MLNSCGGVAHLNETCFEHDNLLDMYDIVTKKLCCDRQLEGLVHLAQAHFKQQNSDGGR